MNSAANKYNEIIRDLSFKNKSDDATTLTPMYLELTYNLETVVSAATFDCIILIIVCSLTLLFYRFLFVLQ
jgi:hypothetical protein